jgi:hypothetical protein
MSTKRVRLLPKRTAVSGRIPTGTTGNEDTFIQQGELAVNTADRKIYSFDGTSVFEFGSNTFLELTGGTITGLSNFNSLSATSFSAGTINSGGTEISTLFLNANGGTKIQPGLNTYTGGTFSFPTVNISALTIDHISVSANSTFNSFSATSFSAGTMFSGSNALDSIIYNIASNLDNATSSTGNTYVQNGLNTYTGGTQSRPNINISSITVSNLSASGNTILGPVTMGATIVNGDIEINGNVNIRGTASTFDVQSIQVSGNTILLNFSGSHISAQFGGLVITSGQTTGGPSSWLIDTAGNWSASTGVFAPSVSATTFYSAGTDVGILINNAGYSNQTHVQPGVNISTGGTFLAPVINIIPSPVFTSISANTITGNTIYSANTELGIIINQDAYKHETHVQNGLNTYTGGTASNPTVNISGGTFTGIINASLLSATTLSASTIYSGNTDLSSVFLTPISISNKYDKSGGTISGNIFVTGDATILGNVQILGTATTINTQILQTKDNNITLNLSGTNLSAIGGGLTLISGQTSGAPSTFQTDINGNWVATPGLSSVFLTGGTIYSGNTELGSVIQSMIANSDETFVQNGTNTYTGGTIFRPTINVSALTISTLTASGATSLQSVSATTIYSGSTDLSTVFSSAFLFSASTGITSIIASRIGNASGNYAVALGQNNNAAGDGSFIGGGENNSVYPAAKYGVILAGSGNTIINMPMPPPPGPGPGCWPPPCGAPHHIFNFIANGSLNTIDHLNSYVNILNGSGNTVNSGSTASSIFGGTYNIIDYGASNSNIISGAYNYISGSATFSTIIGGSFNTMYALNGIIGGVSGNTLTSSATSSAIFAYDNFTGQSPFTLYAKNIESVVISGTSISGSTLVLSSGFQLTPSGQTGYVLTSDSMGNGFWEPGASVPSGTELPPVISVLNTPPTANTVGDTYLVGTGGTNAWSASSNDEAVYVSGITWTFTAPVKNNTVYVTNTLTTLLFNGINWIPFNGIAILQNGNTLGNTMNIGTNDNNNIQFKISGNTAVNIIKPNTATTQSTVTVNYLVVAGGGSGGAAAAGDGGSGGGGAGGWLTGSTVLTNLSSYTITIGSGATAPTFNNNIQGFSGGISSFGSIAIALGGGGGGSGVGNGTSVTFGLSGASGGGSGYGATAQGGAAVVGQGKSGGTPINTGFVGGSGGGGAAQVGLSAPSANVGGVGGSGLTSNISGIATIYAGGGAGGSVSAASLGGAGGGGFGGIGTGAVAAGGGTNGLGGGGGGSYGSTSAGAGGSGVVIISYTNGTGIGTGGIITTSGGKTIHTFLTSSTFTFIATQTLVGVGDVPTAMLDVQGSSVSNASLRIRSGQTVTTLNNGDIWNDGTYLNLNGVGYTTLSPSNFNTTYFTLSTGTTLAAISGNSNTSTVFVQSPSTAGNRNGTASIILQQSIGTGTGTFLLQKNDFITGNIAGNIPNSGLASVSSSAGLLFSGSNIYFVTNTAGSAYAMFFNNNGLRIDAPATVSNNSPSMLYLAAPNGGGTVVPNKGLHIRVDSCNFLTTLASGSTSANTNSNSFSIDNFSNNGTPATVSDAANVFIDGAPTVGGSLVATRLWSLYVNTGNSVFGGKTYFGATGTTPTANVHILGSTTGVSSVNISSGSTVTTPNQGDMFNDGTKLNFTNNGLIAQELPQIQQSRLVQQENQTTNTVLSGISVLSATVITGKTYTFIATLHVTADAVGGSKFAMSGTCTASNIIYQVMLIDNSSNLNTITSRQTILGGAGVGQAGTTSGFCVIEGTITVNGGGTLFPQFCQNASNGTSSILVGSTFVIQQIT